MTSRKHYEKQFEEAREQWGPGTKSYKRRKRRRRKKNPAPECPDMPENLTAAKVKETVDTLNRLNGKVIADLRGKDMQRAMAAAKATARYQHEAFATLFFQCDMRAGRDQKTAWDRMLTFVEKHYGKPFVTNVKKVVPLILKGAKFGSTPQSVPTRALYGDEMLPSGRDAGGGGGELASVISRIQGILDTRNRAATSATRSSPFKKDPALLEWSIRRSGRDFVEMEHAYAPAMMSQDGRFGLGLTPWNRSLQDMTPADQLTLVLREVQKVWAYHMTATCDIDGEQVRSAYRMVPEGKTASLPGLQEVQGSLGFADLDAALAALPGILDSLDDFTYAHVCDDKPLALQDGDRMQFDLKHRKRISNPGLLIPAASVLVTAVGLGDSLYELHSALT